jgi:hypothetical protein
MTLPAKTNGDSMKGYVMPNATPIDQMSEMQERIENAIILKVLSKIIKHNRKLYICSDRENNINERTQDFVQQVSLLGAPTLRVAGALR